MASILPGQDNPGQFGRDPPDKTSYTDKMEARFAKIEDDLLHVQSDVTEIKNILARLAPKIDSMDGFITAILPTLATKADLADKPSKVYLWTVLGVLVAAIFGAVILGITVAPMILAAAAKP